jgi:hypothetical protein
VAIAIENRELLINSATAGSSADDPKPGNNSAEAVPTILA